jgi:hypothetical protein
MTNTLKQFLEKELQPLLKDPNNRALVANFKTEITNRITDLKTNGKMQSDVSQTEGQLKKIKAILSEGLNDGNKTSFLSELEAVALIIENSKTFSSLEI